MAKNKQSMSNAQSNRMVVRDCNKREFRSKAKELFRSDSKTTLDIELVNDDHD